MNVDPNAKPSYSQGLELESNLLALVSMLKKDNIGAKTPTEKQTELTKIGFYELFARNLNFLGYTLGYGAGSRAYIDVKKNDRSILMQAQKNLTSRILRLMKESNEAISALSNQEIVVKPTLATGLSVAELFVLLESLPITEVIRIFRGDKTIHAIREAKTTEEIRLILRNADG